MPLNSWPGLDPKNNWQDRLRGSSSLGGGNTGRGTCGHGLCREPSMIMGKYLTDALSVLSEVGGRNLCEQHPGE